MTPQNSCQAGATYMMEGQFKRYISVAGSVGTACVILSLHASVTE
ncbi:MAG: hypothetical protein SFW36_04870 [Leptolyngbyaceae cyanobacterium bins.59]|nr:hypothetical protein [Leptolyngbyaceae cyanobacterium bins.59]